MEGVIRVPQGLAIGVGLHRAIAGLIVGCSSTSIHIVPREEAIQGVIREGRGRPGGVRLGEAIAIPIVGVLRHALQRVGDGRQARSFVEYIVLYMPEGTLTPDTIPCV
jgi:hypothetical protein